MVKKKVLSKRKKHLNPIYPLVKPDYKRLRDGFTVAVSPKEVNNR